MVKAKQAQSREIYSSYCSNCLDPYRGWTPEYIDATGYTKHATAYRLHSSPQHFSDAAQPPAHTSQGLPSDLTAESTMSTATTRSTTGPTPLPLIPSSTVSSDRFTSRTVLYTPLPSTSVNTQQFPDRTYSSLLVTAKAASTATPTHHSGQPTANSDVVMGGIIGSSILVIVVLVGVISLCAAHHSKEKRRRRGTSQAPTGQAPTTTRTPYYSIRPGGGHTNRSTIGDNVVTTSSHYNRLVSNEHETSANSSYNHIYRDDSDYEEVETERQRGERTHNHSNFNHQEPRNSTRNKKTETSFSSMKGSPCAYGQTGLCENEQNRKQSALHPVTATPPASDSRERVGLYTVNRPKTLFAKPLLLASAGDDDDDREALYTQPNKKANKKKAVVTTPAKLTTNGNYNDDQDENSLNRDQYFYQSKNGHEQRFGTNAMASAYDNGRKEENSQPIFLPLESLHSSQEQLMQAPGPGLEDNTAPLLPLPLTPVQYEKYGL